MKIDGSLSSGSRNEYEGYSVTYLSYWNLTAPPFAGNRQIFFRGQSIDEALARIEFVCNQRRGLATLIGHSGVGKTTLLNALNQSPPRQAELPVPQVCMASMLGLSAGDLAIELAKQTCGQRPANSTRAWNLLSDCFATRGRVDAHTLLLIDDVENCGAEAESDLIRLVRSIEGKNISTVLAIDTQLVSTISRWLLDRSYLHVELTAWDVQQTREYVRFALARCGGSTTIFTDSAIMRLTEMSKGIPRRMAQLADLALIAGAVAQASRIDEPILLQIAQEIPRSVSAAA